MASRRKRIGRPSPFDDDAQRPQTMQEAADIIYADPEKLAELDRIQVRREVLKLDQIRLDGGTQPRAQLNDALIDEYAEEMSNGAEFPRGEVYYDGEHYWLSSGFHRYHARRRAGFDDMAVNVHQGTQRDAQLASVGENAAHGLRRTNEDKRRAVELLLRDAEWGKWSDNKIAQQCRVSQPFVSKMRAELSDNGYKIGEDSRLVERGGQRFTQKRNRQKRQAARQVESPASEPLTPPAQDNPVSEPSIGAALLQVLRGQSLTWGELYNAVEAVVGEAISTDGFNATLRDFVRAGWVITDPNDQAAYVLVRDVVQGAPEQAENPELPWKGGKSANFADLETGTTSDADGGAAQAVPDDEPQPRLYEQMFRAGADATAALLMLRTLRDVSDLTGKDRRSLHQLEELLTGLLFQMSQAKEPLMDLRDAVGRLARGRQP